MIAGNIAGAVKRVGSASCAIVVCIILFAGELHAGVVTTTDNVGPGSLRQAVLDAVDGENITFAVTGTIAINVPINIDADITIRGPGRKLVRVLGEDSQVFVVANDATVEISGLTITAAASNGAVALANGGDGGNGVPASGGAILNFGTLTLRNCAINGLAVGGNAGDGGDGGSGDPGGNGGNGGRGGVAQGGAIFNKGALTISYCDVSGNAHGGNGGSGGDGGAGTTNSGIGTNGGPGGAGGPGGTAAGGAIANIGVLRIDHSIVSGTATGGIGGAGGAGGSGATDTMTGGIGAAGGNGGDGGSAAGGAIFNDFVGTLELRDSAIIDSSCRGADGGAGGNGGNGGNGTAGVGGSGAVGGLGGSGGDARGGGTDSVGTFTAVNCTFSNGGLAAGDGAAGGIGGSGGNGLNAGGSGAGGGNGGNGGAAEGGGIFAASSSESSFNLRYLTVADCHATGGGAGSGNTGGGAGTGTTPGSPGGMGMNGIGTTPSGIGIFGVNKLNAISRSLLARNQGLNCGGLLRSDGFNLSDDASCATFFTDSTDFPPNTDPLLDTVLRLNPPGNTPTYALLVGSPAIDDIPGEECIDNEDQRGVFRPQNFLCDVGAFEREAPTGAPLMDSIGLLLLTGFLVSAGMLTLGARARRNA